MSADPNRVILMGENPFIRLSATGDGPITTNASFWRIITSGAGPGHVLYLKSELTDNEWRIYSDNIAMARWLQATVQGMLNAELKDTSIPVVVKTGAKWADDTRTPWTDLGVFTFVGAPLGGHGLRRRQAVRARGPAARLRPRGRVRRGRHRRPARLR